MLVNKKETKKEAKDNNIFSFIASIGLIIIVLSTFSLLLLKPVVFSKALDKALELTFRDSGYGRYGRDVNFHSLQKSLLSRFIAEEESRLKVIKLDIKFKNWEKLTSKRNEALKAGFLTTSETDYVSAELKYEDVDAKARIRLKGDMTDHLKGNKWSFRIKLRGDENILGLKKFNIQHPQTRGYFGQIVIDEVYKYLGLITPMHEFVKLEINGDKYGIMLIEEHFSKELLERNKRKDGVIVKFDESYYWDSLKLNNGDQKLHSESINPFKHFRNTNVTAFGMSEIEENEIFAEQFEFARAMLHSFAKGEMKASDVFDIKMMGKYLAAVSFFDAGHDSLFINIRFYLNPLTLKLEPIPYDANVGYVIDPNKQALTQKILGDLKIKKEYDSTLKELDNLFKNTTFVSELKKKEKVLLAQLKSEFYFLEEYDFRSVGTCSSHMEGFRLPIFLHANIINRVDGSFLEIDNATCEEIEVIEINSVEENSSENRNRLLAPITLSPSLLGEIAESIEIDLKTLGANASGTLELIARRKSNGELISHYAFLYPETISENPFPSNNIEDLISEFDFFELFGNSLTVKPGIHDVDGQIIIPCGYRVLFQENTTLKFDLDGFLFSCSPLDIRGTHQYPVKFTPKDGLNSWEGIAVYNAEEKSFWQHAVIERTTEFDHFLLDLTGGVTFFKSDIEIRDSLFNLSLGEDALNIIHSNFELRDIDISNTFSDAFDGDFVKGEVLGGTFTNIGFGGGGDAIDVSGSEITATGSKLDGIDDKGISIGEASKAKLENLNIKRSGIAVASKDGSVVTAVNLDIDKSNRTSYIAYMKKPVYGGASIFVENNDLQAEDGNHAVQFESKLVINGNKIEPVSIDVESMYSEE